MQSQHKQTERKDRSARAVSYLPRIMLGVLAVLLVVLLVWSLTGGGTFSDNEGVHTPPAQNNHPETGGGGNLPAAPDPNSNI
ncbi:hypothetical protein ACLBWS_09830 [Brucellaceae bacterium D45D]